MKRLITLNPKYAGTTIQTLANAVALDGLPDAAKIIYHARNTVAYIPGDDLVLKSFKVPGFIKSTIYTLLRPSKAQRAYEYAFMLEKLGIGTAEPLALIRCFNGLGLLSKSYFLSQNLSGYTTLRGIETRPDFHKIAKSLATWMLQLHKKGVFMKDFTPGNIMFRSSDNGDYEFALVDINRMKFNDFDHRHHLLNFRSPLDTADGTSTLAREYCRAASLPADTHEEIMDIYSKHQSKMRRKAKFKNLFRRH